MFRIRNYTSEEEYDLAKYINFENDVYDVLNSQLLYSLKSLPVDSYYSVNDVGYRDIDLIASYVYTNASLAFYIQFYNDDFREVYPEGTVLKMFSFTDFLELCSRLGIGGY